MTTTPPEPLPQPLADARADGLSFSFEAQTADGQPMTGTIDAPDADQATRRLQGLRLRVLRVDPVTRPVRPAAVKGEDFLAFNQQLAHLTKAGLPVEHGLRLIAQDMRTGRLCRTVRSVADDLERGTPLPEAFERHRGQFPPLYGRLVEAGVRTNNLPGVLLNLGRHLDLVHRMRAMLWRSASYPLVVLVGLLLVMLFLSWSVIPRFEAIFEDFGMRLPGLTLVLLSLPRWLPPILIALLVAVLLPVLLTPILRAAGWDKRLAEVFLLPLPLFGPILKRNLVARWCDALRLGVQSGLDLPSAIELAGDAVASPALKRDGDRLIAALGAGHALDTEAGRTALLPPTVLAGIQLSSAHHDLPGTLATLSQMYQQQAEIRLNALPVILTPLLVLFIALFIGFVILALFAPMISLIQAISGP